MSAVGVLINEAGVNANGAGAHWLAAWLLRRPHNVAHPSIGGALIWVPCDTMEDARECREMLARFMVREAFTCVVRLDKDRLLPLAGLRGVGVRRLDAPVPLNPDGWLSA